MTRYRIASTEADLWEGEARSWRDALDRMAQEVGFANYAAMAAYDDETPEQHWAGLLVADHSNGEWSEWIRLG